MTSKPHHSNLAARMGRWSAAHWKKATFGWLAFVVLAFGLGGLVGTKNIDTNAGAGQSGRVDKILDAGFKQPAHESVLIESRSARAGDVAFAAVIDDVIGAVSKLPVAQQVRRGAISGSRHAALVDFQIRGDKTKAADKIQPVLDAVAGAQRAHPGFAIGEFGDASAQKGVETAYGNDLAKAGALSLPVTLIILVLAFGALVAAGIPLLLALTAVFATFGLIALPSHVLPVAFEAPAMVLLIGLAVGVDYSMFYLKRVQQERAAGLSADAALEAAAATSGRSVLISGLTVMTAMAGMFLTGDQTFNSLALATILVVAVAVLGSLTVLPALLSRLGDNVDRLRVPLAGRSSRADGEGRIWGAIVDRVLRRPALSATVAAGLLLALAAPALQLRLAPQGVESFPKSLGVIKVYERMQQAFPGSALPADVVVKAPSVRTPAMRAAIAQLERRALASGRAFEPITADVNKRGHGRQDHRPDRRKRHRRSLELRVPSPARHDRPRDRRRRSGHGSRRHRSDGRLEGPGERAEVQPAARGGVRPPARVRADADRVPVDRDRGEGDPAQPALGRRRLRRARARLPARRRQGSGRRSARRTGSRRSCRCCLFVILFGLSMDYHVFIISRIREIFDRGATMDEAVSHGIKSTAGVVTSAAMVMVFVFAVFGTLSMPFFKQFGVGLAAAILIDATIVRAVLLPATMKLLGDWNWYLPRWLQWLPHLEPTEPTSVPEAQPALSA